MKKYKTLADKVMAGSEFTISHDGQGFGIWDRKAKSFVSKERWPKEKDAKDFLAVSIMLGKDVRNLDI